MNGMNKKCNRNKLFALCMSLMLVFSMLFTTAGFIQNVQAAEGLSSYKNICIMKKAHLQEAELLERVMKIVK